MSIVPPLDEIRKQLHAIMTTARPTQHVHLDPGFVTHIIVHLDSYARTLDVIEEQAAKKLQEPAEPRTVVVAVPDGWMAVPREMTIDMLALLAEIVHRDEISIKDSLDHAVNIWDRLLNKVPVIPANQRSNTPDEVLGRLVPRRVVYPDHPGDDT